MLNCDRFGLHFEVILGAFCITLAIVKTMVLLRENIDLAPFGRSRWAPFFKTSFWWRPGSTFVDDGKRLWAFPFFWRSPRRGGVGGELVVGPLVGSSIADILHFFDEKP